MIVENPPLAPAGPSKPSQSRQTATVAGQAAPWSRRFFLITLTVLIGLGLAVRIRQYAAAQSYWYDEAYLLVNIFDKNYAELCGPLRCDQAAPPLFLWSLRWLYLAAGAGEWVMRLPAFLASVLALLVFVYVARGLITGPGWLWGVGFCALSHHAMTHGMEVKPYALDLLMGTLILAAASGMLTSDPGSTRWRCFLAGLLGAALLGPWLSYPSVFIAGGASLALATDAWSRRSQPTWAAWVSLNIVVLVSVLGVWRVSACHQRTASLEAFWRYAFIDLVSVRGFCLWLVNYLINAGNYATTGLGIPLVILGGVGLVALGRRSPALVPLLVGPMVIALVPNALRIYPLDDRLLFFAAPCIWLGAAAGVSSILAWPKRGRTWLAVTMAAALLLPGAVRAAKHLVIVKPKTEFREAFEFVASQAKSGDLWWVSHPEVAEVYLGKSHPCLGSMAEVARGQRLWLVACVPENGPTLDPEIMKRLEVLGYRIQQANDLRTVVVYLSSPMVDVTGQ